jgi:L-alanine-DL-glutamate epimerase-like enolase superfamily enzyme
MGHDAWLDQVRSPIAIAADESVQDRGDIEQLVGRVALINIKLDKCGGLTEALAMCELAAEHGLGVMTGNMGGTSLAIAPAFLLGQRSSVIDLDGPIFLTGDRSPGVHYDAGYIHCPDDVWGGSLK